MTVTALQLSCRDPVVSRDGRPFGRGQGNRMRSTEWLLPSVVAGSLRTAIGKVAGREFSPSVAQDLREVAVAGVFPVAEGRFYLPAPQDCVAHPDKGPLQAAPTFKENVDGGCNWPAEGLFPVVLSHDQAPEDFKPEPAPAWWPLDRYADWLTGRSVVFDVHFLKAPCVDNRTHVRIDPQTGAAQEENLFTTAGLLLSHLERYAVRHEKTFADRFVAITLAARVSASGWCGETAARLNVLHPLGGERRLVHWKAIGEGRWDCPVPVTKALAEARRVRMILATPAVFRDGWKPGWLDYRLTGRPPGSKVLLRLVGVRISRWRAVSGWSLGEPRGPKPVRRIVPAGGVYFFEVEDGAAETLSEKWLQPVSDDEQERRDGFGLAVWGVW